MSILAIVLIALGAVILLFLIGGFLGARRRDRQIAPDYARHLAEADHALEAARAADRGWDRGVMEQVARSALEESHGGGGFSELQLVLVDDRPGVTEDRAHFEATGPDGRVRVVLTREESGHWAASQID